MREVVAIWAGIGRGWFAVELSHTVRRGSARVLSGPYTSRSQAQAWIDNHNQGGK